VVECVGARVDVEAGVAYDVGHRGRDDVADEVVPGYGRLGHAVREQVEGRLVAGDRLEDRPEARGHALAHREVLAGGGPGGLRLGAGVVLQEEPGGERLLGGVAGGQADAGAVDVHDRVGRRVRDRGDAPRVAGA